MAKRHSKDLRTAIQTLLDTEYVTEGETQTGAELIALAIFDQAKNPESPYFGKALDTKKVKRIIPFIY